MSETVSSYDRLMAHLREADLIGTSISVLGWDQETMMPPRGAALRADQIATLSGLYHELRVDQRVGEWLAACEADGALLSDARAAANVREIRRDYDREVLIPGALVRELAQTTVLAQQSWREARERSDFAAFAPTLAKVFALSRAKAECLQNGDSGTLYDALMDAYEPGATAVQIETVFTELRSSLAPLIAEIARVGNEPGVLVRHEAISTPQQAAFNALVAGAVGFDFSAGRLDVSTHPFCEGIGAGDTRLTTRYRDDSFVDSLSSTLHEVGHGLYEQGLPKAAHPGQPLGSAASLGIHESQSRLWENLVGRSRAFWDWALPQARESFGPVLDGYDPGALFRAVNVVEPSLIRVESDEATYNLHIMLRFDLERALLVGDLPVDDLPGAWNERMRQDLGMDVPDDRRGCLQDIHWSMGAIGYFPTYTLGNLYAAQLWDAIVREIGDIDGMMSCGEFAPLLAWLRERVHRFGRTYPAVELCERATGTPLTAEPFVRYLTGKLRPLYGV
ncbi:MAG: carboxypeptidase M32 [Gemmatimonadetes bacterium]|nr:carboxypeptidase M32 [Gemmatimonadota bacterium]